MLAHVLLYETTVAWIVLWQGVVPTEISFSPMIVSLHSFAPVLALYLRMYGNSGAHMDWSSV